MFDKKMKMLQFKGMVGSINFDWRDWRVGICANEYMVMINLLWLQVALANGRKLEAIMEKEVEQFLGRAVSGKEETVYH